MDKYQGYNSLKSLLAAVKQGDVEYDSLSLGQKASYIHDIKIALMEENTRLWLTIEGNKL
jgi:hypothetical protein